MTLDTMEDLREHIPYKQWTFMSQELTCKTLGAGDHKKTVLNLDPTGKTAWQAVAHAGGSTAFAGKTQTQRNAPLETGRDKDKDVPTNNHTAIAMI